MRFQLDNLIYTTEDPREIERLEGLGAVALDVEAQEKGVKKSNIIDGAKLENLTVEDLKALAEESGLELAPDLKKREIIEAIQKVK